MNEMYEMRESIAQTGQAKFGYVDWEVETPDTIRKWREVASEILNLSTEDCCIAIVRREGELPFQNGIFNITCDTSYLKAQRDMLGAGYVQKVPKEDKEVK